MQNYAIYLKPTNLCNKRCWFCYDQHDIDSNRLKDPSVAFQLIDSSLLQKLSTKSGNNIQFVLHGGEFFLIGKEWLSKFLKLLTTKYPMIQLCGMSNLSCTNFRECYDTFRSYGGNIGTSYNSEVFSDVWVDNLNYVMTRQNNVNLNRVYLGEKVNFDELYASMQSFTKFDNWTFKFERVVKDDVENLYYSSSLMMIDFLDWCLTQKESVIRHFEVFLFCLLKFELDRRFFRTKLTENIGNSLCDMRCCSHHFVVDNALNAGKCTKYFKTSQKWSIVDTNVDVVSKDVEYAAFIKKLHTKICTKTDCKVYEECVGSCKLSQMFDNSGECNNNRIFREFLTCWDDHQLLEFVSKSSILSNYCKSSQKLIIY